ncbi:MAG: alpha/beta hydrolase-fold protein [Verrucomicrobiota bacterium]
MSAHSARLISITLSVIALALFGSVARSQPVAEPVPALTTLGTVTAHTPPPDSAPPRRLAAADDSAAKKRKASGKAARPAVSWEDPVREEPAGTRYQSFLSPTLQQRVSYLAYFPPGYATDSARRYPVIYWLHGLNGDQRRGAGFTAKLDVAIKAGLAPAMIVILVNGMNDRFYCDSPDGKFPVETVIVKDLVAEVDRAHRTLARREARIVEGASMGGLGALYLGFKYPEVFGVVSGVMPGIHDEHSIVEKYPKTFESVYGGSREYFIRNSPWTLVEQNADALRHRTFIRVWIGGADLDWRQAFTGKFHQLLDRLDLEHEYRVIPGVAHAFLPLYEKMGEANWAFYRRALATVK